MATKAEPKYEKFVDADGIPYPTDKKFYRAADESIFTDENQKYQVYQYRENAEKAFPGVEIKEFVGNELEHPIVLDKKSKDIFETGGAIGKKEEKRFVPVTYKLKKNSKEYKNGFINAVWNHHAEGWQPSYIEKYELFADDKKTLIKSMTTNEAEKALETKMILKNPELAKGGNVEAATGKDELVEVIDILNAWDKYANLHSEDADDIDEFNTWLNKEHEKLGSKEKQKAVKEFALLHPQSEEYATGGGVGNKFMFYTDEQKIKNSDGKELHVMDRVYVDGIYFGTVMDINMDEVKRGGAGVTIKYGDNSERKVSHDKLTPRIVHATGGEIEKKTFKVQVIPDEGTEDVYTVDATDGAQACHEAKYLFKKENNYNGNMQAFVIDTLATGGDVPYFFSLEREAYGKRLDERKKIRSEFNWREFNLNQLKEYVSTFNDINIAFLLKNAQAGGAQDKWAPDSKQFIEISEGLFNVPNQSKVQFTEGEDGCLYVEIGVYPKEFGFNDLYLHRITLSSKDNQNRLRELAGDLIQLEESGNAPEELKTGGAVVAEEQKIGGRGFSNYVKGRRLVPADIASLPKGTIILGETTQFGGLAQNAFKVSKTAEELSKHHPDKNILYLQYITSPNLNEDIALWDFELKSPRAEFWLGVKKKAKKHEAGGEIEPQIIKYTVYTDEDADWFGENIGDDIEVIQDGREFLISLPVGKKSENYIDEIQSGMSIDLLEIGTWITPEEKWHGLDLDLESNLMDLGFIARKLIGKNKGKWEVIYRLSDDEFALAIIEEAKLDAIIKGESLLDRDKVDRYLVEFGLNKEEFINSDFAVKLSDITLAIGFQKLIGVENSHIMDLEEVKEKYLTVPHEEPETDELENGGHPKTFWIKDALVHKGTLRKKAKEMGLIKDDEPLTLNDVAKIEKLGGVWIKKCQLARRLMSMHKKAEGGLVDPKLLAFDDLTTAEKEEVNRRKLVVGEPCKVVNKDGERVMYEPFKTILKGFDRTTSDLYGVVQSNGENSTIKIKFLVNEDRPDPEVSDLSFLTEKQIAVVNEMLKKLEGTSDEDLIAIFKNAFDITEKQAKFIVSQRFNPAEEAEPTDFSFLTDEQLEIANCILGNDNLSSSDDELAKTFKYGFDITDKQAKYLVSFRKEFFLHPGENYKLPK